MEFGYPYKTEPDGYIDYFTVNGGDSLFTSQDGKIRVGCYSGPSNNYRTITSSVFFSVFNQNSTTRKQLMAAYMEYFTAGTSVSEGSGAAQSSVVSTANPAFGSLAVTVSLPVSTRCDLGLFDVTGRRIGTLVSGVLSEGTHRISFSGADVSSGAYLVSGTVGDRQVRLRTILLK
jgi:hypothetical protein